MRDWVVAWRGGGAVLPVSCALLVGEGCVECGVTVRDGAAWNVNLSWSDGVTCGMECGVMTVME